MDSRGRSDFPREYGEKKMWLHGCWRLLLQWETFHTHSWQKCENQCSLLPTEIVESLYRHDIPSPYGSDTYRVDIQDKC